MREEMVMKRWRLANRRSTNQVDDLLAVVGGEFCEVNVEAFGEAVIADHTRRAHLIAVGQVEAQPDVRAGNVRNKAFDKGAARRQIEQAAIAPAAFDFAARPQLPFENCLLA